LLGDSFVVIDQQRMENDYQAKLEKWGLSRAQAQVYLALVSHPKTLGASALAAVAGVPRPSVYSVLESLVDKGMVRNGEGYGSQFAALPPEETLPRLMAADKERVAERELLTGDLVKGLGLLAGRKEKSSETELVEILRDPRSAEAGFRKLQREAENEVDVLVKAPLGLKSLNRQGNPAERESLRRGVKHRAIYESALLEDEYVAPFLKGWIEAGEQAREYKGKLPVKLVLFDSKIAWMPLEIDALRHPVVRCVIRHHALGQALRLLFEYLWKESEPIRFGTKGVRKRSGRAKAAPSGK
jgi:sugar-specific transcriptional regulator TrmB